MIEIIIIVQWKFKEKNYVAFDYFYFFPSFFVQMFYQALILTPWSSAREKLSEFPQWRTQETRYGIQLVLCFTSGDPRKRTW